MGRFARRRGVRGKVACGYWGLVVSSTQHCKIKTKDTPHLLLVDVSGYTIGIQHQSYGTIAGDIQ